MKKNYGYEERVAVESALKSFYYYNNVLSFPVEKEYIDEDILYDYFLSDNTQFCIDCEKKMGVAAIRYCYDNPDILKKKQNAQLMSTQMQEALRAAKIEAEYNIGKYGIGTKAQKKYEERKKENAVVQKAVFIDKAKQQLKGMPLTVGKMLARTTITSTIVGALASHGVLGASTAIGAAPILVGVAVGAAITLGVEAIKRLTPKPIKEKIKKFAKERLEEATNVIERNVERFKSTPVGQKVTTLIQEKVVPVVRATSDVLHNAYDKVRSTVKSGYTKVKSLLTGLFA